MAKTEKNTTKVVTNRATEPKTTAKKTTPKAELNIAVYGLDGQSAGNLELPELLFGGKINKPLLAQAIRVYINNATAHFSHTKTRAEVSYSTRKLYRQKGTGRARHGSRKAPVFIGAGIALGPRSRKTELDLPKKMKRAALVAALSDKALAGEVLGLSLDKMSGKTGEIKSLMTKLGKTGGLVLTTPEQGQIVKAVRNLPGFEAVDASQVNVYQVIKSKTLLLSKAAVEKLETRIGTASKKEEEQK